MAEAQHSMTVLRSRSEFDKIIREEKKMHDVVIARVAKTMHREKYEVHSVRYVEAEHGAEIEITAYRNGTPSRYLIRLIFAFRGDEYGIPVIYVRIFFNSDNPRQKKRILLDVPDLRYNLIGFKYYDFINKKRTITVVEARDLRDLLDSLNEVINSLTWELYDYDGFPETPDDFP